MKAELAAAATTVSVLNGILEKERLDKTDISSIIEKNNVYDDHIEVNLLADVDGIINAEAELALPQNRLYINIHQRTKTAVRGNVQLYLY